MVANKLRQPDEALKYRVKNEGEIAGQNMVMSSKTPRIQWSN